MLALNGSLARYLLDDGVDAVRLSQLRSAGSWLILLLAAGRGAAGAAARRPPRAAGAGAARHRAASRGCTPPTSLAIDRLEIGVALTIQYLGPLLLLVWLRVVHGRRLPRGLWGRRRPVGGRLLPRRARLRPGRARRARRGRRLRRGGHVRHLHGRLRARRPACTSRPPRCSGRFGFASLLWAVVSPWWSFPFGEFDSARNAPARPGRDRGRHAAAVRVHGRRAAPHSRLRGPRSWPRSSRFWRPCSRGSSTTSTRRRAAGGRRGGDRGGRLGAVAPARSRGRSGSAARFRAGVKRPEH